VDRQGAPVLTEAGLGRLVYSGHAAFRSGLVRSVADNPSIAQQLADVAVGQYQIEVVSAISLFGHFELPTQPVACWTSLPIAEFDQAT
jgi:hypothetical protein